LLLIGVVDPIQNYGLVIAGWCLMGILALGVGAVIAVVSEKYEAAERFIQPFQYLILPISGFFFMVDWLPDSIQKLAWYMPMIHCFELTRDGFFGDTVPTHYTVAYPLIIAIVLLGIFVPMFEKVRDSIVYG
jgi:capsular polysaccharide transport system permease protein